MKESMLTIPQVAETLAVSTKTVRRLIDRGELTPTNIGLGEQRPRWRITQRSLDNFLRRRRQT
jgi:excisionase family DNA binding protein